MSSRAADMLSNEVREHLERWPPRERALFVELLEDAPSELQREFLQRTVAAGHSPPEVHAFADALRGMTDAEAFMACTLEADAPDGYTVVQLLRAEADPLYAFELKGGELSPKEMESSEWQVPANFATEPPPPSDPKWMQPYTPGAVRGVTDLGASSGAFATRRSTTGSIEAPLGSAIVADLLNEATRALGVSWREVIVDDVGGNPLEDILEPIIEALQKGIVVPVAVGPSPGHHRRYCLMLQLSVAGKSRAFQLYDPFAHELVWANENTLLSRTELPFDDKANRRITRVVLPHAPGKGQ
jgi:hypothetical protein